MIMATTKDIANNTPGIDLLKLCPQDEETLNSFVSDLVELLKTPIKLLQRSDREIAKAKLRLGRRIINSCNSVGANQLRGVEMFESLYKHAYIQCKEGWCCVSELSNLITLGKLLILSSVGTELKNTLLLKVIKSLARYKDDSETSSFVCNLWKERDEVSLTVVTLEELVYGFPVCLEDYLLGIVGGIIHGNSCNIDELVENNMPSLCNLCSNSPKVFQIVITILHELLILSDIHEQVLRFIYTFINQINTCCKQYNFVDLFPHKFRMLVTLMLINPAIYPKEFFDDDFTLDNALKRLSNFVCQDKRAGAALLSYFPDWFSYLLDYCSANNILELVPDSTNEESLTVYLKFLVQFSL